MNRPYPPKSMGQFVDGELSPSFVPALEVAEWEKETFNSRGNW